MFAVEALGLMRDDRVLGPARGYATRGRGGLVEASVLALARVGAREDIELFRELVNGRNAALRRSAVEGLGRSADKESQPLLERLAASDPTPAVRLAALDALQRLGQTQTHLIASAIADGDLAPQAVDYLLDIGPPAMPGVVEALKVATDTRHRATLVQLVGYIGTMADRALLEPLLTDREERVRRAATVAIERIQRGS
jgi:HEAT repeat protein